MFELNLKTQSILLCFTLILVHTILMRPMVFDGLVPQGVDIVGSVGESHQVSDNSERTGEVPLWNPYLFAGMPRYFRLGPQTPSIDTIINLIGRLVGNMFVWYLVGSLGFFIFMRYLGLSPLAAFTGALAFSLLPHYQSLWVEGHNVKFRAVMAIPWVALSARYFFDQRNIFSAACFALAFGNQIRTQHYQIIFYMALLIFAMGVAPFLRDLFQSKWKRFLHSTTLLLGGIILALLLAAQPLFLAGEYLPFSARGAATVDLSRGDIQSESSRGLGINSATQWSTHPSALLDWLVARYHGGMSTEKYGGSEYPRVKGQNVPGYWGPMPFTQSYEYFGPVVLLLALIGLIGHRKRTLFKSLAIFALFLVLLSFGRHFEGFYSLFYDYLPYFKNFRAPMMSITITGFILTVFAAFGFQFLQDKVSLKDRNKLLVIGGGFLLLGIVIWFGAPQLSFIKDGEQFQPEVSSIVLGIREELFYDDLWRFFGLLIVAGMLTGILIYYRGFKNWALLGLAVLISIDLISIQARKETRFVNKARLERLHFRKTAADNWLLKQPGQFRILPLGKLFGDNRWSYFHQNAAGYSAIKMNRMEEVIKNALFSNVSNRTGLNLNILKVLNVKYVISETPVQHAQLNPVFRDSKTGWHLNQFTGSLPRAYFVGSTEIIPEPADRLRRLNSTGFNPAETAILESELSSVISIPEESSAEMVSFKPNQIEWDVTTDSQALLVLAETPYSPGWKAEIDGEPATLFNANHVNMAVVIPKGEHKVELIFHPDSYYFYSRIENMAALILYGLIIGILYRRRNEFIPKKTKTE